MNAATAFVSIREKISPNCKYKSVNATLEGNFPSIYDMLTVAGSLFTKLPGID